MTAINYDITIYVYTSLDDNYYKLYYIFGNEKPIFEKNINNILFIEFNNNNYDILICNIFGSLYRNSLKENIIKNNNLIYTNPSIPVENLNNSHFNINYKKNKNNKNVVLNKEKVPSKIIKINNDDIINDIKNGV